MARRPDRSQQILDAALRLAAERGWRDLTLAEIAAAAGVSLAQLHAAFPSKPAILARLTDRVDEAVLAGTDASLAAEPKRDRLFDLIMRRFDALAPHKEAVRALLYDARHDPLGALAAAPRLLRAMAWMLEAAGISADGLSGLLRVQALTAVYLATLRVWLQDDSPDLSRTMSALDRNLMRAERLLGA
jgi:AcrR family transcriptional regulator